MRMVDRFLLEYDTGDYKFNNLKFRQGAKITSGFGLAKGFTVINGKLVFNTVRVHSGVDRGWGKDGTIWSPFYFDLAVYKDYGANHPYGGLLRLINFRYGFEVRIAHLHPDDLSEELKRRIDGMLPIPRDMVLGKAGDYGQSAGHHTHKEVVSLTEKCEVFEDLLKEMFTDSMMPYSLEEIRKFYSSAELFKDASNAEIFRHWQEKNIEGRRIVSAPSQYKYQWKDYFSNQRVRTRYSSEKLFYGL